MRYTAIIVLAGLLVAALLVKDVLALWVGSKYTFLAPYTLVLFASVALVMTTSGAHHMLKGLGKLRIVVFIALVGLVIVPLVGIVSAFVLSRDPYLAVTVGLAAGNVVYVMMYLGFAMKVVHVSLHDVLTRVYKQPLIAAAVVGVPAYVLVKYGGMDAVALRICLAMVAALAFLAQMYFVFATPAERRQAAEIVQGVWRRVAATSRS
jgi:O-antigen/teichoic acid export membrane protein